MTGWRAEHRAVGPDDTRALGRALARAATPLPAAGVLVALHGDLGAGKTVFVQGVATGLGVSAEEHVVSPTFTIARSYAGAGGVVLHHVDAYRLADGQELEGIGFEEMCGPGCLTCVEWAERVSAALPTDRIEVWLEAEESRVAVPAGAVPEAPRRVRFAARGAVSAGVLRRLRPAEVT